MADWMGDPEGTGGADPVAALARRPAPGEFAGLVLIVDDIPDNLAVLHDALDESGYTVLVATDGASAIARAAQALPDIVLLDAMMPGMDGFEVARRLKADQRTAPIPIVFMTGLTETEHVVAAFGAGGTDYVTKPIRPREVLARVAAHLHQARVQQPVDQVLRQARRMRVLAREQLAQQLPGLGRAPEHLPQAIGRKQESARSIQRDPAALGAARIGQMHADPRQQFLHDDRLGHVVDAARRKALHDVLGLRKPRHEDHRQVTQQPFTLEPATGLEAVQPRHHRIHQHEVRRDLVDQRQRTLAIGGDQHGEAGVVQGVG